MRAFGIVLLVVNLLGAAGFGYLAVQDWKGRQTITAAGLRHLLVLRGLPLGTQKGDPTDMPADPEAEVPFVVEGPGGVPTSSVSPDLLKAYFQNAGITPDANAKVALAVNTPVPNQLAEVRRVYGLVRTAIGQQDGAAAKALVAFDLLINQAETWEERLDILALRDAGNGTELAHLLDLKFYGVEPGLVDAGPIEPDLWGKREERIKELEARRQALETEADAAGNTPAGAEKRAQAQALAGTIERRRPQAPRDEPERRNRLAHLLAHLEPAAGWQKRVALVVGIRQYVGTIAAQAVRLNDMVARVERATADDQERFWETYSQLRNLAIARTVQFRDQLEVRKRLADQAQKDQDIVSQRELQLTDLKDQLVKVKAEVDALLARQTLTEAQLFRIQREVGQTLESVYQMEADLAKRQRDRYEQKKK